MPLWGLCVVAIVESAVFVLAGICLRKRLVKTSSGRITVIQSESSI